MLQTQRGEIEDFLRARGIEWREDASNLETRFARNRIRHSLIPQLEREWNAELRPSLARMADLAGEEERWWKGKIARLARENAVDGDGGIEIPAVYLARLSKPVGRRLVRHLIQSLACTASADYDHVEKVLELAGRQRGSGRLKLPGVLVTRSFDWLRFAPAGAPDSAEAEPGRIKVAIEAAPGFRARYAWDGGLICFETVGAGEAGRDAARTSGKTPPCGCVRLKGKGQQASAILELRGWKQGDHYRPCGARRDQKLKEMFQAARIPSWKRRLWPIVTNGSKILWARKFGVAAGSGEPETGRGGLEMWLRVWEEPAPGDGKNAQVTNHLPSIKRL